MWDLTTCLKWWNVLVPAKLNQKKRYGLGKASKTITIYLEFVMCPINVQDLKVAYWVNLMHEKSSLPSRNKLLVKTIVELILVSKDQVMLLDISLDISILHFVNERFLLPHIRNQMGSLGAF